MTTCRGVVRSCVWPCHGLRGYPGSSWLQLDLGFIRAFHLVSTSTSATGYYYNSFEVREETAGPDCATTRRASECLMRPVVLATCVCVCQVAVDFLLSKGVASRDQQEGEEEQGGHGGASEAKVSQAVAATSNKHMALLLTGPPASHCLRFNTRNGAKL